MSGYLSYLRTQSDESFQKPKFKLVGHPKFEKKNFSKIKNAFEAS
jgi:hypothetical protein